MIIMENNKGEYMFDAMTPPCWICNKQWGREETESYKYFRGILVCAIHDGVNEWYTGAVKMADEKLRLSYMKDKPA